MSSRPSNLSCARARVIERKDVGGGMWLVTIADVVAESFTTPGQYIWVQTIAGPSTESAGGYFALAGKTQQATWEVVARAGSGAAADALVSPTSDGAIEITPAIGLGFPCDDAATRDLVIAVPASAMAVARAVILRRLDDGDAAKTHVLIGARRERDIPLVSELLNVAALGVKITVCLSQQPSENDHPPSLHYVRGYVQDVVSTMFPDDWPLFFVAGGTKIEAGLIHAFRARGAVIHSNFRS